jgi:glycosyltransferase involved in cell wall biosynthesis
MRVLYCHDNIYQQCQDGVVYSAGQFPHNYWDTFLKHFDHLVVAGRGKPISEPIEKLNVSSCDHVSFVLFPNINTPLGRLQYFRKVDQRLKHIVAEADAVIIRAVSDIGWIAYKHAKKMGKPIAMEMAACGWDSTWNHGNKLGKLYAPIRYLRDRIITKNADYVMYVSQEFLQSRYPTNAQTACASNVRIDQGPKELIDKRLSKIKNKEEIDHKPYVIGLIGNLDNKIKGVADTLNALQLVEKQKPGSFIFKHLGPGNAKPYVEQAKELDLEKNVHFDGMMQSGQAVLDWLDGIDLYLQPSYQEGVPRATIEAMSRGCPIIASKAGGIPELINKKWLISPGDVNELARLIIQMLDNPNARIDAILQNYEKSREYTHEFLNSRRFSFWSAFKDFIIKRQK